MLLVYFLLLISIITLYALKFLFRILVIPALSPVSSLPGPHRSSWLWGCMHDIFSSPPGQWHLAQIRKYGKTFSYKGFMNTNRFCTVDTKALGHILKNYDVYQKPEQVRRGLGRVLGEGLLFSEGAEHKKQRKMMNPSFAPSHIRSLLPTFYSEALNVRRHWLKLLSCPPTASAPSPPINVLDALSRMALDIIGLTGFSYAFHSLPSPSTPPNHSTELADAFATVLNHPGGYGIWDIMINWFPILYIVPTAKEKRVQKAVDTLKRVGGGLVRGKKEAVLRELAPSSDKRETKGLEEVVSKTHIQGVDFLSILIRSNMSSDIPPEAKLSDAGVQHQISTFVVAGHETTSTTLTWSLHALALHPEAQAKLRAECLELELEMTGDEEEGGPPMDALEGMPYMDAVVKECLRWNSIVPSSIRTCMKDDVVPFEDGSFLRIKEGDGVFIPIVAINRLEEVWGPDANEFKPERFLSPSPYGPALRAKQREVPGVYSDLMSFIGGPRSCIGVRFAVVEMKAVLYTLLRSFIFSPVEGHDIIARTTIVSRPMVKGREGEGNMLPLVVRVV